MFDAEIANGMALLDAHSPGWFTRIDLDKLLLNNCKDCVLGQLFGSYAWGQNALSVGYQSPEGVLPRKYGFTMPDGPCEDEEPWRALTSAWKKAILKRRSDV